MATWRGPQQGVEYVIACQYEMGPFETRLEKHTVKF